MVSCVVCSAAAKVFCGNDNAFLCKECDVTIHSSNLLAAKHTRTPVCELCSGKVATVFCKNDDAYLCDECDSQVHLKNPLASRHEVIPVSCRGACRVECAAPLARRVSATEPSTAQSQTGDAVKEEPVCLADEPQIVPALSDLTSFANALDKSAAVISAFGKDMDAEDLGDIWLDRLDPFDFSDILGDCAVPSLGTDCDFLKQSVVPSLDPTLESKPQVPQSTSAVNSILSLPSLVTSASSEPVVIDGLTREQRVLRYREKRKNRKFEKTIRYASRKAYAEIRPRIKGRFAKKEELAAWAAAELAATEGADDGSEDLSDVAVVPEFFAS